MKILLTGSTGLLGSHLLEQGLEKGFQFHLPVRKVANRSYLNLIKDNDKIKMFDISNSWDDEVFENCDVIIHCAGFASPFEKDQEEMEKVNIDLTKFLYSKKGNAKFIQISSIATLSSGKETHLVSEEAPGSVRGTFYAKTKSLADEWLKSQNDPDLLTIHPCYMLGKYDSRPSSGSIFFALKMGKIDHYINRTKNFVAASDVAKGIFQAIEKGSISGHFILGGVNIELSSFFKHALIDLKLERILNEVLESESDLVKEFCTSNAVSSSKAMKAFNYGPQTKLDEMIKECIEYFIEKKMIRIKTK